MDNLKKILVVINPSDDAQHSLERGIALAKLNNATIIVYHSVFDYSYEMTSFLSTNELDTMRSQAICEETNLANEILNKYKNGYNNFIVEVQWQHRPFEGIIKHAIDNQVDLIIKTTHIHDKFKSVIFTPTDWHLLRKSPCPVLMVKENSWSTDGNVLCAINVTSDDEEINSNLIKHAQILANNFNASLHLVNGYPGTPINLAIELPDFDALGYSETVKDTHTQKVHDLADKFNIAYDRCHVEEGLPEDVITSIAQRIDAQVVVLGTVGRTGFKAALIGNTAENVIDNITCDLLTIKPQHTD